MASGASASARTIERHLYNGGVNSLYRSCSCLLLCSLLAACEPWPEPAPAAGADTVSNLLGAKVVTLARAQVGAPYLYGGHSPKGFDCSGLVFYVYGKAGVSLPRTAEEQFGRLPRVQRQDLQPGDLVFFQIAGLLHVGIYIGDGTFIHAPETGKPVSGARLDNEYWSERYLGAARPPAQH